MNRRAFSLIELLVVIAIIGILAAIAFPVFARSKDSAYRSSDISNMNELRTALQLYKADQGAFPPSLLGYIGPYQNVDTLGNIIPANAVKGALFPRRVQSLSVFRPSYNRVPEGDTATPYNAGQIEAGAINFVTAAVWPTVRNDLYGGAAGTALQRYAFPNDTTFVNRAVGAVGSASCEVANNYYYRVSGYDVANVPNPNGPHNELRYTLFWSGYSVPADPCNPNPTTENGGPNDDVRQLGYSDPPDTTVVTWNSYYRDFQGGVPTRTKRDIVLFLGGAARPMDSLNVAEQAWQLKP